VLFFAFLCEVIFACFLLVHTLRSCKYFQTSVRLDEITQFILSQLTALFRSAPGGNAEVIRPTNRGPLYAIREASLGKYTSSCNMKCERNSYCLHCTL
jgi:hypothetical protein